MIEGHCTTYSIQEKLNGIALGLFLMAGTLSNVLPQMGVLSYFAVGYLVEFAALGLAILTGIYYNRLIIKKSNFIWIAYFLFILLVFTWTEEFAVDNNYTFMQFIYYVGIGVFLVCRNIDIRTTLWSCILLSWLTIPVYNELFSYVFVTLNQANMGTIYSLFIPVTAGILYFVYYRKELSRIAYINFIPTIILFAGCLMRANRGAILSIIVLFALIFLNGNTIFEKNSKQLTIRKRTMVIVLIILGVIITINFNALFMSFYNAMSNIFGTLPSFLVKMHKYILLDDVSNGRSDVYERTWELIRNGPVYGYGIETFQHYTGDSYPHNFILQFMYEGGVLFSLIPTVIIIYAGIKLCYSRIGNKEICIGLILLFVQVIPRFLLSATPWRGQVFWTLVFYVIYNYNELKTTKGNEEQ